MFKELAQNSSGEGKNIFLKKTISILIFLALALTACAPEKTVIRKGILMRENEAAAYDFALAQKLLSQKKYRDALINLELIVKNYPKSKISADALFKTSQIYTILKDPKKASGSLEELVMKYPLADIINDARLELAKNYFKRGMNKEARDTFYSINLKPYDPQKQVQILTMLKDLLYTMEEWEQLFYCNLKIYDTSNDLTITSNIKNEIFDLIESRLTPMGLYNAVKNRKGSFPGDLSLWKLSKIQYHNGDFKGAKNYLAFFLREYPLSEYYREAQNLYDRLVRRKSPDPQTIGVLLPLSGQNAEIGELALKGIWLAAGLFNRQKGPYDEFKIVVKDTEANPDIASMVFDDLVLESGVIAVIGPMLTKPAETVALKAQEYGIPIILLNQSENLTEIGDYVFRNFITKAEQAKKLAKFAVENMGIKRFAFLYPQHNYGSDFMNAFWDELANYHGTEVRGAESYESKTNDFSEPIKKLTGLYNLSDRASEICDKNTVKKPSATTAADNQNKCFEADKLPPIIDFEALVIPDNYEKIIQIAPSLMYQDVKAIQLIGGNLWNSENLFKENTGRYLQGAIFTDMFFKNSSKPRIQQFVKTFKDAFGEDPEIISTHAYEATSIMLQAIRSSNPQDSSALRNILAGQNSFQTLSGTSSFNSNRNFEHNLSLLIIDGNEIKELY